MLSFLKASEVFAIIRGHKDFELCGLFLFKPFKALNGRLEAKNEPQDEDVHGKG